MLLFPRHSIAYYRALWHKTYAYIVLCVEDDEYWAEFWGDYDRFVIDIIDDHKAKIQLHSWIVVSDDHGDHIECAACGEYVVTYGEIFHILDINHLLKQCGHKI